MVDWGGNIYFFDFIISLPDMFQLSSIKNEEKFNCL